MKRKTYPSNAIVLAGDTDEAGQEATIKAGALIDELFAYWGSSRYPLEPTSHAVAKIQREIRYILQRIRSWETIPQHPASQMMIKELDFYYHEAWLYMEDLMTNEHPGIYTQAITPEQLETLLQPLPEITGAIDYKSLKAKINIVEHVSRTVTLRKNGRLYQGLCPFHEEKTPSFKVYPHNQSWYCFGCKKGGDVIDYAKELGKLKELQDD